jgi:hypothetical protein
MQNIHLSGATSVLPSHSHFSASHMKNAASKAETVRPNQAGHWVIGDPPRKRIIDFFCHKAGYA